MKINTTAKVVATLVGGNVLATGIGMMASIIQARFVEPSVLGYFNSFLILSTYLNLLHIGTIDFMYRELPYLIGKGEREKAEQNLSTCFAWILIALGASSLIFIGLAAHAFFRKDLFRLAGWLVQIAVMAGVLYGAYLGATYRTMHDFSRLAWVSVVQSVAGLALLAIVFFAPFLGLCARSALVSLLGLFLLQHYCPIKVKPKFDFFIFKKAIRRGLPLFIVGYTQTSLQKALEFSIVLHFLGAYSLGLYAFSYTALTALMIIPSAFNQVYLPRISQRFGETQTLKGCIEISAKPTFICFWITLVITGLLALLIAPAVNLVMPKYTGAIPVMIASTIIVPLRVLWVPVLAFYAAGKTVPYGISVFSGIIFFCIAAMTSVYAGWGLIGVVLSVALGEAGRIIVSYILLSQAVAKEACTA